MLINTISDFRRAIRNGPYAWPGGYPLYFVMADGEALSFNAAKRERRLIIDAIATVRDCPSARRNYAQWLPVALEINYEDPDLYCAHTGERIKSVYAEQANAEDEDEDEDEAEDEGDNNT